MNRIFLLLIFSILGIVFCEAQNVRDYIRRGNRLMQDTVNGKDLSDKAIIQYKKAIDLDSTIAMAHYNLGTALIRQSKPQDAMKEFVSALKYEKNKKNLSDIYHNMGVLFHASQKYAEAVDCYKESLRNDPSNNETRYNYVLALWHLKNQQDKSDKQDSENDKKDEEQKQQEEKQENKSGDKKDSQQPQEKQDEEKKQKQAPQQENEMSKENAERILKAAMRNEKETQEKVQRQQQDAPRRRLQKQW